MVDINELIKSSMKSGDKVSLKAFKNLKSEIQLEKTAKNAKPYNEAVEIQLISRMCKKLEDSIVEFSKANREDLVSDYTSELEVLKKLLPEPVSESQVYSFIVEYCKENNLCSQKMDAYFTPEIPKKEMGKIIKALKEEYPQLDGKLASSILKKYVR